MGALLVIFRDPSIEIGLQLLHRPIDLFPEGYAIELAQHGLMEALANPVGLRMPRLGLGVVNVLNDQVEFVFVAVGGRHSTRCLDR